MAHPAQSSRQSWGRVLGLSSRGISITAQRFCDVTSLYFALDGSKLRPIQVPSPAFLLISLVVTSLLMAITMRSHWSGLRKNKSYGGKLAALTSFLQVAPLWEMLDKVLSAGRPQVKYRGSGLQPLLPIRDAPPEDSFPFKGSPGENAMRGVRKLSMCNMLQSIASLSFHFQFLVQAYPHLEVLPKLRTYNVGVALFAGFLSLGFGVADFVLYIWVDDAFVRSNKKLVTLHYVVEILARLPTVFLYSIYLRPRYGERPFVSLFVVDIALTCALLQYTKLSSRRVSWSGDTPGTWISVQHLANLAFSLVVSVPMFMVNFVLFDPCFPFYHVNQVYYYIKYLEALFMWTCILEAKAGNDFFFPRLRRDGGWRFWQQSMEQMDWRDSWLHWYNDILHWSILFIVLNAWIVHYWLPERRHKLDRRCLTPAPALTEQRARMSAVEEEDMDLEAQIPLVSEPAQTPRGGHPMQHISGLENIIEDLRQISKASCPAQRSLLTLMVVKQLWLQGLPWRGTYDDGHDGQITIHVKADTALLQYRHRHGPSKVLKARIEDDSILVDNKHGRFDGRQIRWGAEESWARLDDPGEEDAFHKSVAMVRLIMPQLAAALRWELEPSPPMEAGQVDLDAQSEAPGGRPLFDFLLGYASATKHPEVVSELYWALVCLCHQPNGGEAFKAARAALLKALQAGDDHFLQDCRRRVGGQCEVWRQHTALIQYHNKQSSSGGGNFHHRTTKLREVLRRWHVLRQSALDLESSDTNLAAADAAILASPRSRPNQRAPAVGIDLVDPDTETDHLFLSLPVDPSVRFEGTVVEKSAVLASKQAPLMLVCRTRHNQLHGSLAHSPDTSPSRSHHQARRPGEQVQEKYLLKVGDDLRQDQLVIQLMTLCNCIWRNHLPGQDARLVQLPLFRVLAVTPTSGYVKFVPDSTSLTEVLHKSRGDLGIWLVEHTPPGMNFDQVMDNFCGTVAAGCVASYVLGLGDRHLENICLTKQGQFFHIDFGYFLGEDPKPFAPQVRLPAQVAQALLASKRIHQLYTLTRRAYLALRPFGTLFAGLLNLEVDQGQRYGRLAKDAESAIAGMLERLRIDQEDDERAAAEFLALVRESSQGLQSIIMDKIHAAGLFWR